MNNNTELNKENIKVISSLIKMTLHIHDMQNIIYEGNRNDAHVFFFMAIKTRIYIAFNDAKDDEIDFNVSMNYLDNDTSIDVNVNKETYNSILGL